MERLDMLSAPRLVARRGKCHSTVLQGRIKRRKEIATATATASDMTIGTFAHAYSELLGDDTTCCGVLHPCIAPASMLAAVDSRKY